MTNEDPSPLTTGGCAPACSSPSRSESLFIVFLTVFLFNHANPKGDGMEMVVVGAAMMFIFLPSACRHTRSPSKGDI